MQEQNTKNVICRFISKFSGTEAHEMKFADSVIEIESREQVSKSICTHAWSPGVFKHTPIDGTDRMYRSNANVEAIYYLTYDIDSGATVSDVCETLKREGLAAVIATTRSHQKEKATKSGKVQPACDRFRVVLELAEPIRDASVYQATWFHYKDKFFSFADDACKDPARFYYPCIEVIEVIEGVACEVIYEAKSRTTYSESVRQVKSGKGMLSRRTLNFIANGAPEGQWHHELIKALFDLKENNYTEEEATEFVKKASPKREADAEDLKQIEDIFHNRKTKYSPRTVNGPFRVSEDGVYYLQENEDGDADEVWICSKLEVVAVTRDPNGEDWGRLLRLVDPDGAVHEWAMPMEVFAGDGTECRRELYRLGLLISPHKNAKNRLTEYIQSVKPLESVRCVPRVGWHDKNFVLPGQSFGVGIGGERVILQTASTIKSKIASSGSLKDWQDNVALLCGGNSRLMFAVSAAFAGPLLYLTNDESGGFHFRGASSTGKTTTLVTAGSVWGGGKESGYIEKWRTTINGLEAVASLHCDGLLPLDELSQSDSKEAGNSAYMLANGSGKIRADKSGGARHTRNWRLLFLSSGEIGLAEHMLQAGQKVKAGQETRMVDIPADAGKGMGLFEYIHDATNSADFAQRIWNAASQYYGTPIIAFLKILVEYQDELLSRIKEARQTFVDNVVPKDANGQVSRVAKRFGLVASAGELAIEMGILPWKKGDAVNAAKTCFNAWLESRGGIGDLENTLALEYIKGFLQENRSRFIEIDDGDYVDADRIPTRQAGFIRTKNGKTEFIVFPSVFKKEACAGFDPRAVSRFLIERGYLVPDASNKSTRSERLPGMGTTRVYCINSSIMGDV